MRPLLPILLVASLCAAGEGPSPETLGQLLKELPELPRQQPIALADPGQLTVRVPGVHTGDRVMVLDGVAQIDSGPVDGLEVLACLEGGKTHETLVRLSTGNGQAVKTAALLAFGYDDGVPADEGSGRPARGTPLRVRIAWKAPAGDWVAIDASCLVRDRGVDRAYPPLPYIYTGSRMQTIQQVGADGKPVRRELFMLDNTKSVITNYDEPDALLASPFPVAIDDQRFEAHSAIAPRPGTPVRVILTPAELPLSLQVLPNGDLRTLGADGKVLDEAGLRRELTQAYGGNAQPALRAVGMLVDDKVPADRDAAVRERVMRSAGAAGVWAMPVFVLTK